MSEKWKQFAEELDNRVRPETQQLILSALLRIEPSTATRAHFGIDSERHWEALCDPIVAGEISPCLIDKALGDGNRLTAMLRVAPSNPHKDVVFYTAMDRALGRERPPAGTQTFTVTVERDGQEPDQKERDQGFER